MVRFNTIGVYALAFTSSLLPSLVSGECKDPSLGYSITQGAWTMNGVNQTWIPARLDDDNVNTQNPSWTVPQGTWSYPHGEMGSRGPNYMSHYTCGKLTFCNPEDGPEDDAEAGGRKLVNQFSEQDVWKLASKDHFDSCDFAGAELIGTTSATSCVEVEKDDLTMEGEKSYYASKENCEAGQKLATMVADWESTSNQCAAIALHIPGSDRIRGCDCNFEKKPFSANYASLCAKAYQEACLEVLMPGDCCDTETCMSKLETFDTPEGKEHELSRREDCNDDIPGNCYNMNGVASDLSADGSTECCSQTCSSCGSELATGAVFETCTSNIPGNMTATCGRLSRYSFEDYICDFSKCPSDTQWGSKGESVWKYMGLSKPTELSVPGAGATDIAAGISITQDTALNNDSASSSLLVSMSFVVVVICAMSTSIVAALL